MTKKQKVMLLPSDMLTFIILFGIIIVCFLFFVPKVASTLFPFKRQMVLQSFLQQVQQRKTIPAQAFWQFREFYSPGYYTFDRNGLSLGEIQKAESASGISINPRQKALIFLSFTSPHLASWEALVGQNSLTATIVSVIQKPTILLSGSNETIFTDTKGHIYILFLKSTDDMKTANGFFDYTGVDKNLIVGKYWLDVTVLDRK